MATNSHTIPATPEEVFAVLADARTYQHWVVGCDDIRGVEGEWPTVGSRFFHTVGIGPIKTSDNTVVLEVDPPLMLKLEARARPAGVAHVIFTLQQVEGGTEIEIDEYPVKGAAKVIDNPVQDGLIKIRNVETLRRLEKQVLERRGTPTA